MKRKSAILVLFIVVTGCDYGDNDFNLDRNNFFPLQIGNYWEFHPLPQNPNNDQVVVLMEIPSTKTFSGDEYFLMVTKTEAPNGLYVDSVYYRIDDNGFVLKRLKTGEVSNPFRLGASDGASWHLSASSTEDDMSVTFYEDPLEINSTQFENCRLFSYNVRDWADEEWYTTLAPGVGIVTMHSAWGFRRDLKKAVINGLEYNF